MIDALKTHPINVTLNQTGLIFKPFNLVFLQGLYVPQIMVVAGPSQGPQPVPGPSQQPIPIPGTSSNLAFNNRAQCKAWLEHIEHKHLFQTPRGHNASAKCDTFEMGKVVPLAAAGPANRQRWYLIKAQGGPGVGRDYQDNVSPECNCGPTKS